MLWPPAGHRAKLQNPLTKSFNTTDSKEEFVTFSFVVSCSPPNALEGIHALHRQQQQQEVSEKELVGTPDNSPLGWCLKGQGAHWYRGRCVGGGFGVGGAIIAHTILENRKHFIVTKEWKKPVLFLQACDSSLRFGTQLNVPGFSGCMSALVRLVSPISLSWG